MGLKTKIGMAMATSAAGAAMVVGGSFALFTAEKGTSTTNFTAGTVTLNADNSYTVKDTDQAIVGNMAPGDTVTVSFNVKNTGSLDEWVSLETTAQNYANDASKALSHTLYNNDNGTDNAGHVLGLFTDFPTSIDAGEQNHGLSDQQAAGSGDTSMYTSADPNSDMHHATWAYSVDLLKGDGTVDHNLVSTVNHTDTNGDNMNDWSYNHPFILRSQQTAKVTYTVTLPLGAHNDYQGLLSYLATEVDAVQARNNFYVGGSTTNNPGGDIPAGATVGKDANTQEVWPLSWQPDHPQ